MATNKPSGGKPRLITKIESKTLSDRFYSYVNFIDGLIEKDINAQQKSELREFRKNLQKSSSFLSRLR